jgi:uncharacterized protein with ParB-like and HNH nuclease domain
LEVERSRIQHYSIEERKQVAKKISGAEYPLAKIFSSDFDYVIPSCQRPYAWTTDQASELFDDLYDFFGSLLSILDENWDLVN